MTLNLLHMFTEAIKKYKNIFLVFTRVYENMTPSKQNVKRGQLINVNT